MTEHEPHEGVETMDHGVLSTAARVLGDVRSNPSLAFRECNRLYHRRGHTWRYNHRGDDVFAEDWDDLIVLDACRFDLFEEHHSFPGALESRTSRGSNTIEFLTGNLDGRELLDTVYVTANPQFFRRRDEIDVQFHEVVNVWAEGWDESEGTVPAGATTEFALRAAERFPNKRLLVHYIQPHYPFVGSGLETGALVDEGQPSVWDLAMSGVLDRETVWRAYVENFELALPHVSELLDALPGRTVLTSDHGNMVGERANPFPIREWGHPVGVYTDELVEVPWLVREGSSRKRIVAEEPVEGSTAVDAGTVDERLRDLGYKP